MTKTGNIGAQGLTWATFGAECLQAVYDLRWMIVFAVLLIGTDFWWGVRELSMHHQRAATRSEKAKTKFHFSQAGRRTLNKMVDYLTYLLIGCVAGLAITEPMGIADHTTTSAVGLGFGCLFELSSIVGHIAAVKGINIRLNLKRLLVAIIKHKSEEVAEILDEGIEEIEDNRRGHRIGEPMQMDDYGMDRRHYGRHGDCSVSPTFDEDQHENGDVYPTHHCGFDAQSNTEEDETE